ncbi:DNA binding domain-containing protein, excisionase family [Nakamurella panacisegetis]|uniref:DNA binding domain-containing protein, excisionase family n=1 Tax=Nakamurella panacisegetis TaxID=1090615 RepID=A0A1H0Q0H8_9ACTN|nr:helix-turn-helix domain-containing protein [Nakamurella panacisegetis]SDP10931.1 DNA binding domain-containing protein, excisionase family [Nakamurella panacisegetis]
MTSTARSTKVAAQGVDPLAERYLTVTEVAERLNMSEWYVGDRARRGEIPSIKFGRRRMYAPAAIRTYLARLG